MTEISAFNQAQFIECQALKFFLWPVEEILIAKALVPLNVSFFFSLGIIWPELSSFKGPLAKAKALNFQISFVFDNVFPTGIGNQSNTT